MSSLVRRSRARSAWELERVANVLREKGAILIENRKLQPRNVGQCAAWTKQRCASKAILGGLPLGRSQGEERSSFLPGVVVEDLIDQVIRVDQESRMGHSERDRWQERGLQ